MKYESTAALFLMLGLAVARPDVQTNPIGESAKFRMKREVPQEQSHKQFLTGVKAALELNNVDKVVDPVFALLGNAAAAKGAGAVKDLDCLQQRVSDQAFTNAKAANDVTGMTNALIFRALERNTGKVGLASVLCTSEKAKNPEIAALQQHQDPASAGAAAKNKEITLELARQLKAVGADPQLALKAGTFKAGDVNDNTGKGNTCDDEADATGCIFTQKLIVEDATAAEIDAAAGGAGAVGGGQAVNNGTAPATGGKKKKAKGKKAKAKAGLKDAGKGLKAPAAAPSAAPSAAPAAGAAAGAECAAPAASAAPAAPAAAKKGKAKAKANKAGKGNAGNANAGNGNAADNNAGGAAAGGAAAGGAAAGGAAAGGAAAGGAAAAGGNVNKFTGSVGAPPVAVNQGTGTKPFSVNGSTFVNKGAATQRACDVQKNACANAANGGNGAGITVADCDAQQKQCVAANA